MCESNGLNYGCSANRFVIISVPVRQVSVSSEKTIMEQLNKIFQNQWPSFKGPVSNI